MYFISHITAVAEALLSQKSIVGVDSELGFRRSVISNF